MDPNDFKAGYEHANNQLLFQFREKAQAGKFTKNIAQNFMNRRTSASSHAIEFVGCSRWTCPPAE
jgi:hypothetical protein